MGIGPFALIDTTLREGEQFSGAFFTPEQKVRIARLLDAFGVEYIEVTSPRASPQSAADARRLAGLGLRAKVLAHVRCHPEDARAALATGVQGVNVVIGASPYLQRYSHGKGLEEILRLAREVVGQLLEAGVEVRFSTEDSFRTPLEDLLRIYEAVDALGVHRVGVADTVGIATPGQVYKLVSELRRRVRADVEFHGHNDTGCAIANALAALEAGATHIDVTVLGIGERNGITPLGGLMARLYTLDPASVARYDLRRLPELDRLVADLVGVEIPFNNYITGSAAFCHRAGIHVKAVLNHPATYEALRPEAFGVRRRIEIGHRLTGWNALRHRAQTLGLRLSEGRLRQLAREVKARADRRPLSPEEVDALLQEAAQEKGGER